MFLRIIEKIPVLNSMMFFSYDHHRLAFPKFLVLWMLSTSPIILAVLLSPVPAGDIEMHAKLVSKLREAFSGSEQYIYAASFISPLLYIIWDRYKAVEDNFKLSEKVDEAFKSVFKGYGLVSALAVLILLATITTFSATKIDPVTYESTFLYALTEQWSFLIYLYALICWYLSILDAQSTLGDYVGKARSKENDIRTAFSNRISSRKDSNE